MAPQVLEHRMILKPEYEIEGLTVSEVILSILRDVAVPR
jgi:MoxR-like ATPase